MPFEILLRLLADLLAMVVRTMCARMHYTRLKGRCRDLQQHDVIAKSGHSQLPQRPLRCALQTPPRLSYDQPGERSPDVLSRGIMGREAPKPSEAERAWQVAQTALSEARSMPPGAERNEALKRAGRLRLEAERMRQAGG